MDEPSGEKRRRCPICGRPSEDRFRPFCSRRCADVDLARWLGGAYAVPVVETDEDDEAALEEVKVKPLLGMPPPGTGRALCRKFATEPRECSPMDGSP